MDRAGRGAMRGGRGAYYKAKYGGGRGRGNRGDDQGGWGQRGGDGPGGGGGGGRPWSAGPDGGGGGGRGGWGGGQRGGYGGNYGGNYANQGSSGSGSGSRSAGELANQLRRLDGANYGAYKSILGTWNFDTFDLEIDYVQSDPYAAPSCIRLVVPQRVAQIPEQYYQSRIRRTATGDFMTRWVHKFVSSRGADKAQVSAGWHGGKGGDLRIDYPGQHVLERTSMIVSQDAVEARVTVGLPARGRSIQGHFAADILCSTIPDLVENTLVAKALDLDAMMDHVVSVEDQESLRQQVVEQGLVAFVANGSLLPRRSGNDDRPMERGKEHVITFQSPESLQRELTLSSGRKVQGMGIEKGVTVIVGGGFHGKSTLLKALEVGVYNHIPGDGREFVVTDPNAVKIRAEDGRGIVNVNISPFICNLPYNKTTQNFSTPDASGSTSQAANIIEALEVGATTLLMDEDTCATNFMIRDADMQKLVAKKKEPITPFISRTKSLFTSLGVSSILVIGGSGAYFRVADTVVMMDSYVPKNVTAEAKAIAADNVEPLEGEDDVFPYPTPRAPIPDSIDALGRKKDREKVSVRDSDEIGFGSQEIDLSCVEQVVEKSQTRMIADTLLFARDRYMDGTRSLSQVLDALEEDISNNGIDVVKKKVGNFSRARRFEIGAALNRLRTVSMKQ